MGEALHRLRRMPDAAERLEEAERAFARVPGLEKAQARAWAVRSSALLFLGRYEEVVEVTDDLLRLGRELQDPYYLRVALYERSVALKALRRWPEASAAAGAMLDVLGPDPPLPERGRIARVLLIQAEAERHSDRPESGIPLAEKQSPLRARRKTASYFMRRCASVESCSTAHVALLRRSRRTPR